MRVKDAAKKRELVALLLEEEGIKLAPAQRIRPRAAGGHAPLSFAQQRLWFLNEFAGGSSAYNISLALHVQGRLDAAVLARALNEIVRRHEVLRTTFTSTEGLASQVVHPSLELELPLIDFSALSEPERIAEVERMAREEAENPFDLRAGPLVRVKLLYFNEQEHVLLLTMHHITSDAWSVSRFLREMRTHYKAFINGKPSPLPELPIQYADFAVWQREWLQGEVLEEQLAYWRRHLAGAPSLLELPTDRPRPAVQSFHGTVAAMQVSTANVEALKALSQREGVTLFMTLLAVFKVLLHRYTGQSDIVVGTPVAGRSRAETEQLIGFFVNTLAVRTDLSGDPTFTDVLRRVREVCLGAFARQDLPFEKLVDELQPERNLSHTPIFQVAFSLQHEMGGGKVELPTGGSNGAAAQQEGDFTLSLMEVENGTAKFDISLFMADTSYGGLSGSIEYNTDLFDALTIQHFISHFLRLLKSVVASPDLPISRLSILSEAEIKEQLVERNDTRREYPETLLHELVQSQAEAKPGAVALVFEGTQLTYAELNGRANQLAHFLRARGVGPESRVGVLMERSIELVVSLLAVLKAGAAYVPFDPEYPQERLRFMLRDSRAEVLLTQQSLLQQFDWLPEHPVESVAVDAAGSEISQHPAGSPPPAQLSPDNLAYIIYTSGSTGQPKGAMNTHRAIVNRLLWMQESYRLTPDDRVMQKTPFSFDVSVWEFFWPLLTGARLVLARPGGHRDTAYLVELIEGAQVTTLHFVPTMLQVFLEEPTLASCRSLRQVMCSGEALSVELVNRFHERLAGVELHNLYGPTEAAVDVSYFHCQAGAELRSIPIGRPVSNTQLYVLDRALQPVPVGVSGELYIGGVQLARGYWGRAGLTAERFVPDPFVSEPGQRLYRTGDAARFLSGGEIEYVGRLDQQVKLRGFRIELGEIEAALMAHESVREATVIVYGEQAGAQRLAAYFVPTQATPDGAEDEGAAAESQAQAVVVALRQYLKERLPDYMVPAVFIPLRQMPVTPNGKVDRKALPAPEVGRAALVALPYQAPRNGVEEVLALIWGKVLKIEKVGVHDNFFALGGDSIRSLQVVGMSRERGLYLTLQQMFEHQTIAEQATALQRQQEGAALSERSREPFSMLSEADRAKIPEGVEDAYPLSMLQGGMLYHMEVMPEAALYHNVNSMHLKAAFDEAALREATRRVVARHEVLRTSFDLTSYGEPLQLVHREAEMSIGTEDLRGLSREEQERRIDEYIAEEKRRGFDYGKAPLLRFFVHVRDDERFQFTLTECHAIQDGWSLHTTLAEVFEVYFKRLKGEEVEERGEERVKYRDFVAMEREALASEEQHRYWQNKLYGNTFTNMPRWPKSMRERAEDGRPRVRFREVPISIELSDGLKELARWSAVPVKSVVLAAHLKVMSLLSGHRDVLTGVVSNGRPEESGGERAIGLFLNTLPFRLRLPEGSWLDLVRATFDNEWELLPYRRYPMAALQTGRGREQLYETAFNFIHFHVVADMLTSGDVELLGTKMVEATNWVLQSHFSLAIDRPVLGLRVEYDSDEWSEKQMEGVEHYFANVLAAMAADPTARHDRRDFLSTAERRRQLEEWAATETEYPRESTFAELFQQQVERSPDAVAVVSDEGSLTYEQLNRQANALAHALVDSGVGPESLVALLSERSTDFLIAMLASFKAGAAYLPLDPVHPVLRHLQVLEQSRASVLLRSSEFAPLVEQIVERLDASHRPLVFPMEAGERPADNDPQREENLPARGGPGHLAYVIYTSGSTGLPKGVMVEQRGMINHLWAKVKDLSLGADDVIAQTASQCFDISVWQFLAALLVGGRVQIVSPREGIDPMRMLKVVRDEGVTVLETVPSLLRALLDEARQQAGADEQQRAAAWGRLRWMVATGEALLPELCREWFASGSPHALLLNAYGPTECSDDVTHYVVESAPPQEQTRMPIGRALANTQLYVLDEQMMPVPIGVTGELYVGGDGVGRGYLRDGLRTARRFVPHPYAARPGERLYRTGDVCRYLPNGELEFLGRVDQQVKVRGYRIELGEIEAVLGRHEGVKESVVEAREDGTNGEKLLAAYVVRRSLAEAGGNGNGNGATVGVEGGVTSRELWEYLTERLPEYMVPPSIMLLDEMPLTPNGKIDRKALPAPEGLTAQSEVVYVPPRNELEQSIANVWREVLHVERVGMNDNFFDLGGHSIRMIEATSKLRLVLGRELNVVSMFQYPTVSRMAEFLSKEAEDEQPFAQDIKRAETRGERTRQQREARRQRRAAELQ